MKTFGKRPSSCPRLRPKDSYAKLVEDRDQKQKAFAKSVQQVAQRDIDDIFAPIQHIDEQNVDDGVEIDALAAEIRKYEAEGWIAPPENNDSDIDDYY
jgi:peptidoglycan hydrolase CwlO-like protein